MSMHDYIEQQAAKRKADAERYAALDEDECQLCGAHGEDKRSFIASCFYDMQEVVPEFISLREVEGTLQGRGFYLRLCKDCRGKMLSALKEWADKCRAKRGQPMDHDGHLEDNREDAIVPVRINGAIVMLTPEEFEQRRAESAGA